MKKRFYRDLAVGDEVFWNDPDEGRCSRVLKIYEIQDLPEDRENQTVVILGDNFGSIVEAFLVELS